MSRETIVSAAIFGIGWGLTRVCPGPAIAGFGVGSFEFVYPISGIGLRALLHGRAAYCRLRAAGFADGRGRVDYPLTMVRPRRFSGARISSWKRRFDHSGARYGST